MAKNDYWRKRELEHIKQRKIEDAAIAKRLKDKYQEAKDDIQEQIEAFYGRYASREGISMANARKRVSKLDIDKYSRKAKKYVKERNFSKVANEEMRLYNVTMKINRLELLKKNIQLELLAFSSDEERLFYEELTKAVRTEYERQSGILGMTVDASEKHMAAIVDSSFMSAKWSDRIWNNQVALRAELDKLLHRGIVQGLNPRELARELRKVVDSSVYNAERLMRTEMARVQQDVFQDSMHQAEIEQYRFIAESDACDICAELDDKTFYLKDAEIGVNTYPMHPNCRCSTSAYVSRKDWEAKLEARGL